MSKQCLPQKRLLPRYCSTLTTIARFKNEEISTPDGGDGSPSYEDDHRKRKRAKGQMEEYTTRIDQVWQRYASAYDQLKTLTKGEMSDYKEYSAKAKALSAAVEYTALLQGKEKPNKERFAYMYCGEDHKARSCTKYTTSQEQANYLREHNLCFISAPPQQNTTECDSINTTAGKPVSVAGRKERATVNHRPSSASTTTYQLSNQHQEQDTAHIEQQDGAVAELHSSKTPPTERRV
ncbi:hypothetical protein RB195_022155 [Necator americanus]|uniref:Uncharacterized protein n=1 Tax=Necator americanus TaxID=51031 RepID=A0ABR1EEE3_NECAM